MIVTDEHDIGRVRGCFQIVYVEHRLVGAKGASVVLQIFAAAGGILRADFALHARKRGKFRHAAPGS